jgi:hypothetical protein
MKKKKKPVPFMWITHDNRAFYPKEMASSHIYHSIRMMFNNIMPPALRVDVADGFRRWPDVKYWSWGYLETAIYELTRELMGREDYILYRNDVEDMMFNADLYLRLTERRVLMVELP